VLAKKLLAEAMLDIETAPMLSRAETIQKHLTALADSVRSPPPKHLS
jgi:hypothetical protein